MTQESILEEAQRITHGPRKAAYGHPLDGFTQTAGLVSALLSHKLKAPLTAHETALILACVKLAREMNTAARDNMTDLAGYAWVARECLEEDARRRAEMARAEAIEFGLDSLIDPSASPPSKY